MGLFYSISSPGTGDDNRKREGEDGKERERREIDIRSQFQGGEDVFI